MEEYAAYTRHYSDRGFWSVIRRYKDRIPFLRDALGLFYCLKDPATPAWVRLAIAGGARLPYPPHRHHSGFYSGCRMGG